MYASLITVLLFPDSRIFPDYSDYCLFTLSYGRNIIVLLGCATCIMSYQHLVINMCMKHVKLLM